MSYKVEKNVPMPEKVIMREASELTRTLLSLEIGDSFVIEKEEKAKAQTSINGIRKTKPYAYNFFAEGDKIRVFRDKDREKRVQVNTKK